MPRPAGPDTRLELLQGTLELLILQILQGSSQHGYAIGQALSLQSGERLHVDTGSLYPALHRLERQKFIKAEWKLSENKQRTKVYHLTAKGRKQLLSERSRWAEVSEAIRRILSPQREGEA